MGLRLRHPMSNSSDYGFSSLVAVTVHASNELRRKNGANGRIPVHKVPSPAKRMGGFSVVHT